MRLLGILLLVTLALPGWAQDDQDLGPILDLSKDKINLVSDLNQMSGSPDQNFERHLIEIDLKGRRFKITNDKTNTVVYDVAYSGAYAGQGQSISMKEGETLFIARDDKVNMITYEEKTATFSIMMHDQSIQLFGWIYIVEDESE